MWSRARDAARLPATRARCSDAPTSIPFLLYYEYNSALVEEDYLPQDRKLEPAGAGGGDGQEDAPSGEGTA